MAKTRKNKLKAIVAGWKWGSNHVRAIIESSVCDLAGIWTRKDNPNARDLAKQSNAPLYTDFDLMLKETVPNIATIAVPESAHEALTLSALRKNCHVYCEKVLAPSTQAARRMVSLAGRKGCLLNVGYNYRYSPSCRYLADAIRSGKIGIPLFAHLRALGLCIHHMTDYVTSLFGKPLRAVSRIRKEPLPKRPLPFAKELVFPTFVYCALTMKTYMVEYENKAVLLAGATDYSNGLNPGATLLIEGSEGRAILDDLTGKVTLWSGYRDMWSNTREAVVYSPSQIIDRIGLAENCVSAVKDFVLAVHEGRPTPIPGEDGLRMIQLEEAIWRSSETGKWEKVR